MKLFWALLLASGALAVTCPSPTGACELNCTSCSGSLDCSANSVCSVDCAQTFGCSGLGVTGIYQPNASDYAVTCTDTFACSSSIFTTRTSPTSRFWCNGQCSRSTFICNSDNCELVCDGTFACNSAAFRCPGGSGKTCNVQCNGNSGCSGRVNVTCAKYPCNVTFSGNQTSPPYTPLCAAGLRLCGDGSCVNSSVTTCPSECIKNDPCKTASGNTCTDVGGVGGPHNCTCNAPGFIDGAVIYGYLTSCVATLAPTLAPTTNAPTPPTPAPTRYPTAPSTARPTSAPTNPTQKPTTQPTAPTNPTSQPTSPAPEGYSLTVKIYSTNDCTGTPSRTQSFPTGACASSTPGPGQFAITRCTAAKFCQIVGTGTCGGLNFACSPSVDANVCLNGTVAVCNMNPDSIFSGAGQVGVGWVIASSVVTIAALLAF